LPYLTLEQAYLKASENMPGLDREDFLQSVRTYHAMAELRITGFVNPQVPGVPAPTLGLRQEIPPEQAASMYPSFKYGGIYTNGIIRLSNRPNPRWEDIVLETEALNRLWPAVDAGASEQQAVRIYNTGLAGRPTSKHLIGTELRRIYSAEIAAMKTSELARAMLDWLEKHHPEAPAPTLKALRNFLPSLMRELKLGKHSAQN
jgi:hypothetical protein